MIIILKTTNAPLLLFSCYRHCNQVNIWGVFNKWPVHVFEPLFWTGQLLNTLRLKARAFSDGSNFDADPHELQVTWRSVYNDVVWLYESYLWIEMYL